MKNFFNSENFLWQWFGRVGDFFILSCLWTICCMPVVTIGAASVALYDTVAHCVRGKEQAMFRRFFRTFRAELVRSIALTLVWAAAALALNIVYQFLTQLTAGTNLQILGIAFFVLLLLPVGTACWVVAIESRFTHSFGQLHRNALTFTIGYLPQPVAIAAIFVVGLNVLQAVPFLVMFLPGLMVSIQSHFIEPVFAKYQPQAEG